MKIIFDDYIDNAFGDRSQSEWKKQAFAHNYRLFFPDDKNIPVLDIGIGRGEMLWCMREWGYVNYEGVDISPSTVDFCTGLGYQCRLVKDTVGFLRDAGEKYGVITVVDVVEHIPKNALPAFLVAIREALLPGGKVIIQTPNMQAPDAAATRYHDITHEVGLDERSLGQLLKISGFGSFEFHGYEEYFGHNPRRILRRLARHGYQFAVRLGRNINGLQQQGILHPFFFAVASAK